MLHLLWISTILFPENTGNARAFCEIFSIANWGQECGTGTCMLHIKRISAEGMDMEDRMKNRLAVGWIVGFLVCFCGAGFCGYLYDCLYDYVYEDVYGSFDKSTSEHNTRLKASSEGVKEGSAGKIALTFDDGPHPTYTEELLDGLKERNVTASFFVLGEHAELYPDLISRMQEEGHLIGNHTYSHLQLKDGNWEEYRQELDRTNEVICEITGSQTCYVRPPYGSWDRSFEQELGMFPVLWTVDSRDWCSENAVDVVSRVLRDTQEGDIILMHDYYATTVDAALAVVDRLQEMGYSFVTVEEILFD